ncbi:MAG: yafE [Chloroflexi bacterium]|nr:yafE [Chloroflexota bacterium]
MNASAAEQFNSVAQAYATSAVHAQGPDLPWLVTALEAVDTWSVLDVGTGAGHASLAVAPSVRQVTAIDIADRMLATAARLASERSIANVTFRQASVAELPFASGTFDGAFTRYSAHHWPNSAHSVGETARVLRPGAPFVLIDTISPEDAALGTYINALELLRDPSHVQNPTLIKWQGDLECAGFVVESVRKWQIDLVTLEWLRRAATIEWRAAACRHLLSEAPPAARAAFTIAGDGESFQLPCALIKARRA